MSAAGKWISSLVQNLTGRGMEGFGKWYSCYRAWVIENEDPEGVQRLKLVIPQVLGHQVYDYWAYPKGVYSGKGYGSQVIPKKGDMVWVEFEGGCPEVPIWSHGHFSRKEVPTKDLDYKDINVYWFRTPKGNLVKFNDTKNLIHIENPVGDVVEINEKGISLVTTKTISLGTLNKSKYKAVLGEPIEDLLKDINKVLKELHGAMVKDILIYTARGFTNTVTAIPKVTAEVATLTAKLNKILSKKNTLD